MTASDPLPLATKLDDWQSGRDFSETNWMMFTNKIACDVTFLVGERRERISAHKFILVSRSSVFLAMFYGPLAEKAEVEIPDAEPDVFHSFLRYLYTNTVDIIVDNVVGLLYAGKKYSVSALCEKCVIFLSSTLSVENACDILEQTHLYCEEELEQKALTVINLNAEAVFKSSGFKDICRSCLIKILKSDNLRADEIDVFRAVLWWSEAECQREGREATPENRCDVLADSVNHVRFPLIGLKSFGNHVGLLDKDWVDILRPFFDLRIDIGDNNASNASARPRRQPPNRINRFQRSEKSLSWTFSNRMDAISFSCDKPVTLLGLMLYGAYPTPGADDTVSYSVVCSVEEDLRQDYQSHTFFKGGDVLEGSCVDKTVIVNSQEEIIEIYFDKPIALSEELKYTILLNMSGPDSRRGCRGRSSLYKDDVCWTFYSSTKSKNSTDVEHGQIPGLIYSF